MDSSNDAPVCNIDRKGIASRRLSAQVMRTILTGLVLVNAAHAKFNFPVLQDDWRKTLLLWWAIDALSVGAFSTQAQVDEKTCVAHGLMRTEEEGPESMRPQRVKDARKADLLFWRSARMIARGFAMGTAVAVVAIAAPYVLL